MEGLPIQGFGTSIPLKSGKANILFLRPEYQCSNLQVDCGLVFREAVPASLILSKEMLEEPNHSHDDEQQRTKLWLPVGCPSRPKPNLFRLTS